MHKLLSSQVGGWMTYGSVSDPRPGAQCLVGRTPNVLSNCAGRSMAASTRTAVRGLPCGTPGQVVRQFTSPPRSSQGDELALSRCLSRSPPGPHQLQQGNASDEWRTL
jgi:hypothetical protein